MAHANGTIPTSNLASLPLTFSNTREQEYLTHSAYASLVRMMLRATADTGSYFSIWDAYRSLAEQVAMLKQNYTRVSRARSKSSDRSYGGSTWAKKSGRPLTASPGHSNHGNGLAIDIHPGPIQTWMRSNAARFGWVNDVPSEPWHWSYLHPGADRYRSEGLPDVAAMQRALGIEADGKPGPGTASAVRDFQKQNGLTVDGIAGPATKAAMLGEDEDSDPVPGSVPGGQYTVEQRPTKNRYVGREKDGTVGDLTAIVIHHWGADGQNFDTVVEWLRGDGNGNNDSSAHEVIDGNRVAVLAPPEDSTWSTGTFEGNLSTYSFELRPEADEATLHTAAARIRALREETGANLPLTVHQDYVDTACPGRWLQLIDTLDALARGGDVPVSTPGVRSLPTGKELLVKLTDCPDFPLLRTPDHLCYYGHADGPITSVSGKSPNSLVPGEIVGSGKSSGARGLKRWQQQVGIEADGRFGNGTEAKVRDVQATAGLAVDGKLGPVTWYATFILGL